jgi:Histidine kinase-, DNA gyrase B-, and HSP90-like ATPase
MPKGGMFRISVTSQCRDEQAKRSTAKGDLVAVQFSDTGLGIPAHLIARVFEPFFTTKEIGKGSGLGLRQVYEFARQAGGYVTVSSLPKAGTTVAIYLRRVQKSACEVHLEIARLRPAGYDGQPSLLRARDRKLACQPEAAKQRRLVGAVGIEPTTSPV